MTAHELAQLLLIGPDYEVTINSKQPDDRIPSCLTALDQVRLAAYWPTEESDGGSDKINTVVLIAGDLLSEEADLAFIAN